MEGSRDSPDIRSAEAMFSAANAAVQILLSDKYDRGSADFGFDLPLSTLRMQAQVSSNWGHAMSAGGDLQVALKASTRALAAEYAIVERRGGGLALAGVEPGCGSYRSLAMAHLQVAFIMSALGSHARHGLRQSTPWKFFKVSSKGNDRAVVASKRRTTRSRRHLLTCLPESQIILLLRMHGSLLLRSTPLPWRTMSLATARLQLRALKEGHEFLTESLGMNHPRTRSFAKTYAEIRKKSPYLWRWPVLSEADGAQVELQSDERFHASSQSTASSLTRAVESSRRVPGTFQNVPLVPKTRHPKPKPSQKDGSFLHAYGEGFHQGFSAGFDEGANIAAVPSAKAHDTSQSSYWQQQGRRRSKARKLHEPRRPAKARRSRPQTAPRNGRHVRRFTRDHVRFDNDGKQKRGKCAR